MAYAPWLGRNIGVEMEMNEERQNGDSLSSRDISRAIAAGLADCGANADLLNDRDVSYYHSSGNTWDVKTDSSCGWEVASRILQLDETGNNRELEAVCNRLKRLRPVTGRSTGHHLHVDLSDLNWQEVQRLCWLWARYEPFWHELVHESRRGNSYCDPLCRAYWYDQPHSGWHDISRALSMRSPDAFRSMSSVFPRGALNMGHWWRHGRIEIRLHHGTVDYEEIRFWAMLVLALVGRVKQARLPEIKPYTPSAREVGYNSYYIWKAIGLVNHRDLSDTVHPVAGDLFVHVNAKRRRMNPDNPHIRAYRDRAAERIRTLSRETTGERVPAFDTSFHRSMENIDTALGRRRRLVAQPVDLHSDTIERLRQIERQEVDVNESIVEAMSRPYMSANTETRTSRRVGEAVRNLLREDSGFTPGQIMRMSADEALRESEALDIRRAEQALPRLEVDVQYSQQIIAPQPGQFYIARPDDF